MPDVVIIIGQYLSLQNVRIAPSHPGTSSLQKEGSIIEPREIFPKTPTIPKRIILFLSLRFHLNVSIKSFMYSTISTSRLNTIFISLKQPVFL